MKVEFKDITQKLKNLHQNLNPWALYAHSPLHFLHLSIPANKTGKKFFKVKQSKVPLMMHLETILDTPNKFLRYL